MPSPPSTRRRDARGRQSSAFVRASAYAGKRQSHDDGKRHKPDTLWFASDSEIETVRPRQTDPFVLIVLDRIVGADVFRPYRRQAAIGDAHGPGTGQHLRIVHGDLKLESFQSRIRIVTGVAPAAP